MARSTANNDPKEKLPKGMMKFKVIGGTTKDCLGRYCQEGDMAALDKKRAQALLDLNVIKVELPDFEIPEGDDDDAETDAGSEDTTERAETEAPARTRRGQSRSRATSDG